MPKITLITILGNSYICSGFLSIGVHITGTSAVLIDSGGDESCATEYTCGGCAMARLTRLKKY